MYELIVNELGWQMVLQKISGLGKCCPISQKSWNPFRSKPCFSVCFYQYLSLKDHHNFIWCLGLLTVTLDQSKLTLTSHK